MKTPDIEKRKQRHVVKFHNRKRKLGIPFRVLNKPYKKPNAVITIQYRTIFVCHQPVQIQTNYFDNSK